MPPERSFVLRTVKPPLSLATTSEPRHRVEALGEGEADVLVRQRRAELGRHRERHALEAARVQEVDGGVRAAGGLVDALELVHVEVVDEALGDEDHGLAALGAGQPVERALEGVEGRPQAGHGLVVHLGGAPGDVGVLHGARAPGAVLLRFRDDPTP